MPPEESQTDLQHTTLRKIRNRCVLPLLLAFVISYLDRVNVGFAALTANRDLGLTPAGFGWGAGLLFLGYCFFELPSNLALERFGARRWIARIMITWGAIGCAMALVTTPTMFYVLRFLLGVAEAGLFPGVILYLTYWYPAERRGGIIGMFMTGIPIAGLIGGPLSGWIMNAMAGTYGLAGWQWMFLIEALPSIVLGLLVIAYLDDGIAKAKWLTADEKDRLARNVAADNARTTAHRFRDGFTSQWVWFLSG